MRKPNNFKKTQISNRRYHNLYWGLHKELKSNGIKIYHSNRMRAGHMGLSFIESDEIIMNSDLAGTFLGLIILLHEYRHNEQYKNGLFSDYFNSSNFTSNGQCKLDKEIVFQAEWDCYSYAQRRLKQMGVFKRSKLFNKEEIQKTVEEMYLA